MWLPKAIKLLCAFIATLALCATTLGQSQCGQDVGSCPTGQCCSVANTCGTDFEHCGLGCQLAFGLCANTPTKAKLTVVGNGLPCGAGIATCGLGCCSQTGYCGVSDDFCGAGCQIAYGLCSNVPQEASSSDTCGAGVGSCASGCCSRWGWCGTTVEHCGPGCQVSYGTCTVMPPAGMPLGTVSAQCGGSFGACPAPFCCGQWGYCGLGSAFCSAAQSSTTNGASSSAASSVGTNIAIASEQSVENFAGFYVK